LTDTTHSAVGVTTNVPLSCAAAHLPKLCHAAVLKFRTRLGDCNIFTRNKHYALAGSIAQLLNYLMQMFICSAHSIKN